MKRKRLIIFVAATAFIGAIALFTWSRTGKSESAQWVRSKVFRDRTSSSDSKTVMTSPKPLDPRLDHYAKDKPPKLTVEDLEPLLNHFHHSAVSVALVFVITRDRSLLLELKDHDKDPAALVLLATSTGGDERCFWARRLAQLQPDNSYGKTLEASKLFEMGRREEAMAALNEAVARPSQDAGLAEIAKFLPEAAPFLPQDRLAELVYGSLDYATTIANGYLTPFNMREILGELSLKEAVQVTRSYISLYERGISGSGYQIVSGEGLETPQRLFDLYRESFLGDLESTKGVDARLSVDSEPSQAMADRNTVEFHETIRQWQNLSPAKVDGIVAGLLGSIQLSNRDEPNQSGVSSVGPFGGSSDLLELPNRDEGERSDLKRRRWSEPEGGIKRFEIHRLPAERSPPIE